jgi:hypothetical protein
MQQPLFHGPSSGPSVLVAFLVGVRLTLLEALELDLNFWDSGQRDFRVLHGPGPRGHHE